MQTKRKKMFSVFTIIFLVSTMFFSTLAIANDDLETIVDADINIVFKSATDFYVNAEMTVRWASAFGEEYNQNEVISLTSSTNIDDIEALGVIKNNLHNQLKNQLENVFGPEHVSEKTNKPNFITPTFNEEYDINLSYSFFDLNDSVEAYDLVNGVLDLGGIVDYGFVLKANDGWNVTYIIDLGKKYDFKITDGKNKEDGLQWSLLNGMGEVPEKNALLKIYHKSPTSNLKKEEITLEFYIDGTIKKPSLSANVNLNSINISNYGFMPAFITDLQVIPADGVRLFVKNNLVSWDEIYQTTVKKVEMEIKNNVESSGFNQSLALVLSWENKTTDNLENPYDVEEMDKTPAVTSILKDDEIQLFIEQISSNALFGLVNTGAKANLTKESINFGENLENIGYEYNITLKMPEGIEIDGFNNYTWNENNNFSGQILSKKSPDYKKQEMNSVIELEIEDIDLNLLSFFTGSPEINLGYSTKKEKNYTVTKLPDEFSLPEKINIAYLNSDAIRLCIDENIFKESEIDEFLTNEKNVFEKHINQIITGLDVKANIDRNMFEDSLNWDKIISDMDSEKPVKTRSYTYATHNSNLHISIIPPSIKIPDRSYNLKGLKDQSVTYKIIFPNGVSVDARDEYDRAIVKTAEDGRQYIEVSFTPEDDDLSFNVSCSVVPSALFLIGLFTPCLLSFFITVLLLIVLILFRKKRRRGRKVKQREPEYEEVNTGYEERDYYIPPPPGSK